MSKRQTQEQERAKQAWENVHGDVKGKNFAGEYKSLVSSAPADIQTNGLGQTVAFLALQRMGKKADLRTMNTQRSTSTFPVG